MASEQERKQSRVGKLPVQLPAGVDVTVAGGRMTVKGPKGSLERAVPRFVTIARDGDAVQVTVDSDDRQARAFHGLSRALLQNMVTGVSAGFTRGLEVIGVGYRADLKGDHILFQLGYSHPIMYELPSGVKAAITKDNKITLTSIDKEVLGHAAATIRSFRKPEPYKGKGIKYAEERIRRKAGKAAAR